ncbi:Eco57I restriction-modification methylase domain-containing protein [Polaribacter sp. M15]
MIDYKVRQKRDGGTNPLPNYTKLTPEEEVIITKEIIAIAEEKKLNIMSYNICGDHIHLLLVCEEEEVPKMMQIIKAKTARKINIHRGVTTTGQHNNKPTSSTREPAPLSTTREPAPLSITKEPAPLSITKEPAPLNTTKEPAPLPGRGKKQNSLWTQKYGCKDIKEDNQLYNTVNYIQTNRTKHELPSNKQLQSLLNHPILNQDYDHAFTPQYTGGFDVVIGNPPYVRKQGLVEHYPEMCKYYEKEFQSATANYDIYALFMERSFELINNKGIVSYILPHKFLVTDFGEGIRRFFKDKTAVDSILHFGSEMVFADASTYTCIINLSKSTKDKVLFKKVNPLELAMPFEWDYILLENLSEQNWDLQSQKIYDTIKKLKQQPFTVDDVFDNIFQGIATSLDAVYVFEGVDKGNYIEAYNAKYDYRFEIEKTLAKPYIKGNEISKYKSLNNQYFVFFPYENGQAVSEESIKAQLPKTYAYLKHFETEIRGREKGRMNIEEGWYLYIYPKSLTKFGKPKIMTQEISLGCNMTYDEKGEFYHPTTIYSFVKNEKFKVDEKFYLGILNSKVMWFFLKNTGTELRGGYFRFKTNYLKPFPLPEIPTDVTALIKNVNLMLSLKKELQKVGNNLLGLLASKFNLTNHSKKLQNWHELSFGEFLKELEKARKKSAKENKTEYSKLSLSEEAEWMQYFNDQKQKATKLKAEIDKTDKEIDQMVYELYGLTADEIKIVEEATK